MRHGVLLVDKPLRWTSHDCVQKVRSVLGERKVGHLGTLDPLAQGLLVLFVGSKALKVLECFSDLPKTYAAEITLGKVSSTYDSEGVVSATGREPREFEGEQELQDLLRRRFVGSIEQVPPAFSAVKLSGVRAYSLARKGDVQRLTPRNVQLRELEIIEYAYPKLLLSLCVSSGFYVRTLAHEVGELLQCGGYLSKLIRTAVGPWKLSDAVSPMEAEWSDVRPLCTILGGKERLDVTDEEAAAICHGRSIEKRISGELFAWHEGKPIALLVRDPKIPGRARPRKIL
jgi:tRNA pseudouridine55 synthase